MVTTKPRPASAVDVTSPTSAAFEAFFMEHWARVCGLLTRLVGDRLEAEDLAVEAFWQFYQRAPQTHPNLTGWLYRVATNLGLNALRAAKRRVKYEAAAGAEALEQTPSLEPAQAYEQAEQKRLVRAALQKLPEREAQVLLLKQAGLSYKEIAEALKVAPSSVGTLLARAEAQFAKAYAAIEKQK